MSDTGSMASRSRYYANTVKKLGAALNQFRESGAKFRVLRTVSAFDREPQNAPRESLPPPKTLFILDSSFNPPSIAHGILAQSLFSRSRSDHDNEPTRLLLLFAITNADKAPAPASFEDRLTMMLVFAGDLLDTRSAIAQTANTTFDSIAIDIGVTTAPYYADKSAALATEGREWYPLASTRHVHLVGFDTLTRIFTPKYYAGFDPPFSALQPYFDAGHRLRATLRPDDAYGTTDEQKAFIDRLESGEMEAQGARRDWARQIELVPSPNGAIGVSSTRIRRAASQCDWQTINDLCTPGVAEFVLLQKLYAAEAT